MKKRPVKNPAFTALDDTPHGKLISLDYRVLKIGKRRPTKKPTIL